MNEGVPRIDGKIHDAAQDRDTLIGPELGLTRSTWKFGGEGSGR